VIAAISDQSRETFEKTFTLPHFHFSKDAGFALLIFQRSLSLCFAMARRASLQYWGLRQSRDIRHSAACKRASSTGQPVKDRHRARQ
jgi:hypothetical protein